MGSNKRKSKKKHNKKEETEEHDEIENPNEEKLEDHDDSSSKRPHDEDDSDVEEKPKKKKKKPIQQSDGPDKKGKKSIRQMKKEKFLQRQADAAAANKEQLKSQCISYLSQWKHDRQNWKFMKAKQVWLYKNKFSSKLVPNASWSTLLEYFESAKGNIRNMLLDDANKIIKQMDEWSESNSKKEEAAEDEEEEEESESKKPDDIAYKRARDLIQCLQE